MLRLFYKKTKIALQVMILSLLFIFQTNAQCPPGNVTLGSQAAVDAFATNYPNCTEIQGNLHIEGSDIVNLNGLSALTTVGGNLNILNSATLTNVDGLSSLTSIGGNFRSYNNTALTNVDGLSSLTSIGGRFEVFANAALTNVNGLSSLTSIGGEFGVFANATLANLNGLSNVTSVGHDIIIKENLVLSDISALQNTSFNPNNGLGLIIEDNPALAVCNLPNFCAYLANDANTHPRDISGNLANCLDEQAVVTACNPPQCPPGDVTLTSQAEVDQFIIDYPNCTEIDGFLEVNGNNIVNLNGLSNLTSVDDNLLIHNTSLINVTGLSNLTSIGGAIGIGFNPALTSLNGLNSLTNAGGAISIVQNSALTNIDGLNNVTSIGDFLRIESNAALANVNGLSGLTSIVYGININDNAALTNLNGLSNVTSSGLLIYIADNLVLSDISALQNISISPYDTLGLTISNNPALAVCNLPNFCAYLANDASTHPRDISGNLANCLDEAAVVAACTVLPTCPPGDVTLSTQAEVDQFIIDYPNCTQISGNLLVEGNDVVNLSGLSNIVNVTGYVRIYFTNVLTNLNGLGALVSTGGALDIWGNASLTNLNGLSALTTVGADIYILNNTVLNNISALQNTTFAPSGIYGLTIKNNPMLAVCNLPNFCTYLANDASTHPRNISGNLANCLDEAAVVAACNPPVAGCTNVTSTFVQFPSYTYAPQCTGSPEDITGNYAETGEYSKIQLTANIEYTFSSSVTTDYITISNEDGTVIYAHGYSPLDWMPSSDEIVRFFLHLDDGCNTSNTSSDWRSRSVQCDNLSVPDINMNTISFYPNPVNDILNLSYGTEMTNVSVVNLLGQTVISQSVNSDSTQIDMSSLPVGNYFVEITSEVGIKTIKVIKK